MIRSFADKMKDKQKAYEAKQKILAEEAVQIRLLEEERQWEKEQLLVEPIPQMMIGNIHLLIHLWSLYSKKSATTNLNVSPLNSALFPHHLNHLHQKVKQIIHFVELRI